MEQLRDSGQDICECSHIRRNHVDCGLSTGLTMCHGNIDGNVLKRICYCPIFKATSEPIEGHDCRALACKTTGHKSL
jgi:hypothetical protein